MKTKKGTGGNRKSLTTKQKKIKYTHNGDIDYHYIYTITINQKPVIDNDWDLDIIDLAIFAAIKQIYTYVFSKSNKSLIFFQTPVVEDSGNWAIISESYILKNCPLLPLNSSIAVYKRIIKLEECKLIERHPLNAKNRTKLLRLGINAHLFDFATNGKTN